MPTIACRTVDYDPFIKSQFASAHQTFVGVVVAILDIKRREILALSGRGNISLCLSRSLSLAPSLSLSLSLSLYPLISPQFQNLELSTGFFRPTVWRTVKCSFYGAVFKVP